MQDDPNDSPGDRHSHGLLVCDDHDVTAQGLYFLIEAEPDFEVIARARDGRETLRLARDVRPDIMILDFVMPRLTGLAVLEEVRAQGLDSRVIFMSGQANGEQFHRAWSLGAQGVLSKADDVTTILAGLRAVAAGERYMSDSVRAMTGPLDGPGLMDQTGDAPVLTQREREVLTLIANGHSTQAIARQLGISEGTARKHRENLMRKLKVHSVSEVTRAAHALGLSVLG